MAVVLAASAQAQFYAKIGVGVNMPAANTIVARKVTTTDEEVVKGSYGKGISPVLGIGYMFNPHVGVELGASYLLGSKYESVTTTQSTTTTTDMKANGITVLPAVVLKTGDNDSKIRLYSRAGLMVNLGPKFTQNMKSVTGTSVSERTTEYKSNLSLGYTGALGVSFRLNKMIGIWVEAVGNSTSSWQKSGEITASSANGVDNLGSIPAATKSWNFTDKKSNSSTDVLAYSEPMSSIGLAIGATFTFGNK